MNILDKLKVHQKEILSFALVIGIFLIVYSSIFAQYVVPTGSMEPTIKTGDHIFVNKMAYSLRIPFTTISIIKYNKPLRGDIVAFIYPIEPDKSYIKRLIGLPGDRIRYEDNELYINDQKLEVHPYDHREILANSSDPDRDAKEIYQETIDGITHIIIKNPPNFGKASHFSDNFFQKRDWVVPENHYFMMGDNRDNSSDSRVWGFVPEEHILGKAMFTFYSLQWNGMIPSLRWEKTFTLLN